MDGIGIGIVSGLLTTFIVVLLRYFWINAVQPWYEERIYKDAQIEGQWVSFHKTSESLTKPDVEERLILSRRAHSIEGRLTVLSGLDKGLSYLVKGEFRNLILTCHYSSEDESSLDRGSYCLMLKENGRKLEGVATYLVDEANKIKSSESIWVRHTE